jgi:hypothetical protein
MFTAGDYDYAFFLSSWNSNFINTHKELLTGTAVYFSLCSVSTSNSNKVERSNMTKEVNIIVLMCIRIQHFRTILNRNGLRTEVSLLLLLRKMFHLLAHYSCILLHTKTLTSTWKSPLAIPFPNGPQLKTAATTTTMN